MLAPRIKFGVERSGECYLLPVDEFLIDSVGVISEAAANDRLSGLVRNKENAYRPSHIERPRY
jgi:hypothetical protein